MRLTLPYPPRSNTNWRMMRGRMVLNATSREYRATVAVQARADGVVPMGGSVSVTVHIYRPRRSGDLDGRLKVLLDALNNVAFFDDSQIIELHAWRHDDRDSPRAEVEVVSVHGD